jgi:hypothetical protein
MLGRDRRDPDRRDDVAWIADFLKQSRRSLGQDRSALSQARLMLTGYAR